MGLYALSARTADWLRRQMGMGGERSAARNSGPGPGNAPLVKVTGPAVAGWFPGLVTIDQGGTLTDLTAPVWVAATDGATLETGKRYSCTRTGDDPADGRARFRTTKNRKTVIVTVGPFCVGMTGSAVTTCDEFGGSHTSFILNPILQVQTINVTGEDVSVQASIPHDLPPPF